MSFQEELSNLLKQMEGIPKPEALMKRIASLRPDMETPTAPSSCFRGGSNAAAGGSGGSSTSAPPSQRSFGSNNLPAWRSGAPLAVKKSSSQETFQTIHKSTSNSSLASTGSAAGVFTPDAKASGAQGKKSPITPPATAVGRYQSRFVSKGNIEEKILNTIIGNKLNAFTPLTYNDTRDFIYQILDSGELEFIKDFVEKVFLKATVEELYCALFAKLLAEIAQHYPIMYEEMNRYHTEFLKVFEDVQEGATDEASIKKRQYRLGYGQFISELASLHALPKEHLLVIVQKVGSKMFEATALADKSKVVEEYIDCLVRLTTNLRERSTAFYRTVLPELKASLLPVLEPLIDRKAGDRPSLSTKARYALMDLKDLLV